MKKYTDARSALAYYDSGASAKEILYRFFDSMINNTTPLAYSDIRPPKGFPIKRGEMTFKMARVEGTKIVEADMIVKWTGKKWTGLKKRFVRGEA